jgi:pimeloyl-ACP methyl ester carboxylesterase
MPCDLSWSRKGSGPPLILLHGGGPGCSSETDFAEVTPALGEHRTVLTVDLHQYGDSPSVRIEGPAIDHHVGQLIMLLDELQVSEADLACQSLGSLVALRLAEMRPDLVRRLVLTGAQPIEGDPGQSTWTLGPSVRADLFAPGEITASRMRSLMAKAEWSDPGNIPESLVRRRVDTALRHHRAIRGDDPSARGAPQRLDGTLPAVSAPTLLLWGADDAFATPSYARVVAGLMPSAHVQVIPRAGHHCQSERPDDYASAALSFLLA